MNKKQLACEAVLYEILNPEEFARAKMNILSAQNNYRSKRIKSSERFHTNEVLAKKFGTSKGYIIKMKNLYRTDREAFDYIHETGKDIPRLRVNGVYLISAGIPGPTKIGRTDNLEMRLCSIQTGSWQKLEIVKWMPIEQSEWFEKELHYMFQANKLHGEWFELSKSDVSLINQFYQREIIQLEPKMAQAG